MFGACAPGVEMMKHAAFNNWINRTKLKPRVLNGELRKVFEMILEDVEGGTRKFYGVSGNSVNIRPEDANNKTDEAAGDESMQNKPMRNVEGEDENSDSDEDNVNDRTTIHQDHKLFGQLLQKLQEQRRLCDVFRVSRQLTKARRDEILSHMDRCMHDDEFAKAFVTYLGTPLANMVLMEKEAKGERIKLGDAAASVLSPRQIIGDNTGQEVRRLHNCIVDGQHCWSHQGLIQF
jgi:hypothetical protein